MVFVLKKIQNSFKFSFNYFNEGFKSENHEFLFASIYAFAIILNPQFFSEQQMNDFLEVFVSFITDIQDDCKNIIVFFFLQVIQNYSSFFNFFEIFLKLFDESISSLPNYCTEYLANSLEFLIRNFSNTVPQDKSNIIQNLINEIKENQIRLID